MVGRQRRDFYTRQVAKLEEELAAVERDLDTKLGQADQLRLKRRAEQILEELETIKRKIAHLRQTLGDGLASRESLQEMIDALKGQRRDMKSHFDAVVEAIKGASAARLAELEEQQDRIHRQLATIDAKIQAMEQQQSNLAIQGLIDCLSSIYEQYASGLCRIYWRSRTSERRTDTLFRCAEDLVREAVGTLDDAQDVSVLHRFVIYLLIFKRQLQLPSVQANYLKTWAMTYIPQAKAVGERLVAELNQAKSREQQKPSCLLVRIRRSSQQSKPGAKGERYFIESWFVKDVAEYRKNPARIPKKVTLSQVNRETGEVGTVSPDQTYSQAELESTLRRMSRHCQQEFGVGRFVIQVFLPFQLMQLAVDRWHLRDSTVEQGPRLGTMHDVYLRSLERWDRAQYFLRDEWSKKWHQVHTRQDTSAHEVFVESAIDEAYGVVNDSTVIGLRLTESLCGGYGSLSPVQLLETVLLDTSLPLALWMRQAVSQESGLQSAAASMPCCAGPLHTVLDDCVLRDVHQRIQKCRSAVLKFSLDKQRQQSGSHLALLWDDPTVPLPILPSGSGSSRSAGAA